MVYSEWRKKILDYLSRYKENSLSIQGNGLYRGKEYPHILPEDKRKKNYLEESFDEKPGFKKHTDWFHLNSSQTLCVNFFAALNNDDLSKWISTVLKRSVDVKSTCFEYVPVTHGSNFDFYICDTNNNHYYFEIKYTESGFGKKGGGENPHEAYKKYYKEDVESNPIFKSVTEDVFLNKHFQAYRNMVKGKGNDYSIIITMKSNAGTYNDLQSALCDLNVDDTPNVVLLYWEELIEETLELFKDNHDLRQHYDKFKNKYIPTFKEDLE